MLDGAAYEKAARLADHNLRRSVRRTSRQVQKRRGSLDQVLARNLTAQAIGPRLRQAPPSPNSPAEPARRNLLTYVTWTHSAHGLLAVKCQARDLERSEEWREPRRSCSKPRSMNIQGSLLTSAFSSRSEPGPDHKQGTPMAVPSAPTTPSKTTNTPPLPRTWGTKVRTPARWSRSFCPWTCPLWEPWLPANELL